MLRPLVLVVLAMFAPAAPAEESTPQVSPRADAGALASHADATLSRVVVVDSERRQVTLFAVDGSRLELLDRKPLDGNIPDVAPAQAAPTNDSPGEDPPGVPRIKGAVRTSYRVDRRDEKVFAAADYDVPLPPAKAFEELRRLVPAEWAVKSAGFGAPSASGSIEALRGTERIVIEVQRVWNTDRTRVTVRVSPR